MSLQDIDRGFQFGEDPPEAELPPVDRGRANRELEDALVFSSWTCRFCGATFADRKLAIKHAIACDENEDNHTCATCVYYEIGEDSDTGYRHICRADKTRKDTWMRDCPQWWGRQAGKE